MPLPAGAGPPPTSRRDRFASPRRGGQNARYIRPRLLRRKIGIKKKEARRALLPLVAMRTMQVPVVKHIRKGVLFQLTTITGDALWRTRIILPSARTLSTRHSMRRRGI